MTKDKLPPMILVGKTTLKLRWEKHVDDDAKTPKHPYYVWRGRGLEVYVDHVVDLKNWQGTVLHDCNGDLRELHTKLYEGPYSAARALDRQLRAFESALARFRRAK